MSLFKKFQASYNKLEISEKLILRVLSVVYEPVNQTTLGDILAVICKANKHYRMLDLNVNKALKHKLEARGLIEMRNGRMKCCSHIEEWLTLQTVSAGEFDTFLAASLHHLPLTKDNQLFHYSYSRYDYKRRLRYALYRGEDNTVFELLGVNDPYAEPDYENARRLVEICANPLDGSWFARLHPAIQYQILRPILKGSVLNWSDAGAFYELLADIAGKDSGPHTAVQELMAEQRLYRGDWQSLTDYLDTIGTWKADTLKACLFFLEGKTSEATITFRSVIARVRRETRKRNISIDELPGVIYLLTLLKDQDPENNEKAKQQFKLISKQKHSDRHDNDMLLLDRVRDINDGKCSFERIFFTINLDFCLPFTSLIVGLALFWNNQKPGKSLLSDLAKQASQAEASGYLWFARECNQLLAGFEDTRPGIDKRWGPPLTSVIPKLENWERSLRALTNVPATSPPDVKQTGKPAREMRIAWFIDASEYGPFRLRPKEQKQKKNGNWTAGRAIALKRLAEEFENISYATDADRKICRSIRHSRTHDYYGSSKHSYTLDGTGALLAAEGHPCLFRDNAPGLAVEITKHTPRLLVIDEGEQIHLTLEPYQSNDKYLVIEETPERIGVYEYSKELLHIAQILTKDGLLVPKDARDKLLQSISAIAPLLTIHSDVAGITDHAAEPVDADGRLYVHLQPLDAGLRLSFHVQPFTSGPVLTPGHGGESLFAEIDGKQLQTKRDLDTEKEILERVISECRNLYEFAPNEWRWDETDEALEGLLKLQDMDDKVVLTWPEGKEIRLSRSVGLGDMSVSLRRKTEWFEIDGELNVDDGQVHSMQVLMELTRAGNSRFIQLGEGQFLALTSELRKRLDELESYTSRGRIHSLNAINLEESIDGMVVDADGAWDQFRQRLQCARDLQPELPSTLQAELRDYQVLGYNWLCRLSEWGAGACLADDMGLGKTLQSLALILNRAAQGPTLILAPTSVCANWIDETLRFAPTLNPIRFGASNRQKTLDELKPFDLLICSYGLLQTEASSLQAVSWQTLVADEAQAFKNASTKRSKAVMELEADFKMIATGTPIENHLGELWNLFQFINPGLLGSRETFNNKFAYPIENQKDPAASGKLKNLISPFILRRLKRDVLTELPPRTDITLRVDLGREETALYEALRLEAVSNLTDKDMKPNEQRIRALAGIMKLRRAVCNPNMVLRNANIPSAKLEMFNTVLQELLENNHKALVFSQFVDHLSLIRAHLDKQGISYQYLDGSTSTRKRTTAIRDFQAGEGDIFLISLKAGGVGLNLTAADYVIHMDPWWNPAVEDQASDRAHRIGQQRPVTVYRIVANDTIEEKIVALHAQKRDLADSLLEGSEMSAKMTLDDMLSLLDNGGQSKTT
jgi:SNF2 family DNA or RNA helicase